MTYITFHRADDYRAMSGIRLDRQHVCVSFETRFLVEELVIFWENMRAWERATRGQVSEETAAALGVLYEEKVSQAGLRNLAFTPDGLPTLLSKSVRAPSMASCGKGTATWWPMYLGSCNWLERSNTA